MQAMNFSYDMRFEIPLLHLADYSCAK